MGNKRKRKPPISDLELALRILISCKTTKKYYDLLHSMSVNPNRLRKILDVLTKNDCLTVRSTPQSFGSTNTNFRISKKAKYNGYDTNQKGIEIIKMFKSMVKQIYGDDVFLEISCWI